MNLRPGKYEISATPPQRPPSVHVDEKGKAKEQLVYASATYYPGTVDKSRAIAVEVHAGDEASANFSVLKTHAYRVSGMVGGVPSGAMVRFFLTSNSGSPGMDNRER